MGTEIERKFLVTGLSWRALAEPVVMRQGYLCANRDRSVRVRIAGAHAWLTIKGGRELSADGLVRSEFEYAIPSEEARELLALCEGTVIEKRRYRIPLGDLVWEVDEFEGANQGLVVAEVELEAGGPPFKKPEWIGREVTDDPRYLNANLVECPFSDW